jgi:tetratricopeptide (TPR) repeat protein
MTFRRTVLLSVLGAGIATPLAAQGIPRGATVSQRAGTAATRIMVANPYVFASNDSATAVEVGRAMRDRMSKAAPRGSYLVIPDSAMNAALAQYDYPRDAILNRALAQTLAQQINGRVLVTSQMAKNASGQWAMVARLSGTNDGAGNTVRLAQEGRTPPAMGAAAVDALQPALRSLEDARECMNLRVNKPQDAARKAQEALKDMPSNGLAHYCLAQMAQGGDKIRHLEQAVAGDSLSLLALGELAAAHEAAGDTAKTVAALQQMLRAAPTDQELRQRAFRYFLSSGRAQAAIEVADEGLQQDPSNWDLYDLKSNACLFASNFQCAVHSLEQAYTIDSMRADTMFFIKIAAAAEQRLADSAPPVTAADTATFVRWARTGAGRYPQNLGILQNVAKAYSYTGDVDSTVAVARRLWAIDTTNVTPLLAAGQVLITAGRADEGMAFVDTAMAHGDEQAKQQAAGLLLNAALPFLQNEPTQPAKAADLLRRVVAAAPTAQFAPTANYLFGIATLQQVGAIDPEAERTKSCELARQMQTLLGESKTSLEASRASRPEESARYLGFVNQYIPRAQALVRAYCR